MATSALNFHRPRFVPVMVAEIYGRRRQTPMGRRCAVLDASMCEQPSPLQQHDPMPEHLARPLNDRL